MVGLVVQSRFLVDKILVNEKGYCYLTIHSKEMSGFRVEMLLFVLLCVACSEPSQIGTSFFQDGDLTISYVDTVSVKASTVLYDSLATNSTSRLLIGHDTDEQLGTLTCKAYLSLAPDGTTSLKEINSTYSRITLNLLFDHYSFYDTTVRQRFYVSELKQKIALGDDGYLYNTSQLPYQQTPLGQIEFASLPNKNDTLEIPLSDQLGNQLYNLAKVSSPSISETAEFQKLIKGLVVHPDVSINAAVLGFKTEAQLRVYYIDKTNSPTEEKFISFSLKSENQTNLYFNEIRCDRSLTNLKSLRSYRYPISSDSTDHKVYVQGGAGLAIRVELPHIKELLRDNKNLIISEAVLEFIPIDNSDHNNQPFPSQLMVNYVNEKNESLSSTAGTANLITDLYLGKDIYYQFDLTDFIKQQLSINEFNHNALLFSLPSSELASSVTKLYAGDAKHKYKMKVKMNVVNVKNVNNQ